MHHHQPQSRHRFQRPLLRHINRAEQRSELVASLKEGQEAAVFEELSDKLQSDISDAVTKALKETLK